MDQVDREASTKEFEQEGIVNQECVTVESTNGMEYFARFPNRVRTLMTCQNSMTFHDFFHDLLKNSIT